MAETNEDPLGESGEVPGVETKKAKMVEAGKAPAAKSRKTPAAETRDAFVAEIRDESVAEAGNAAAAATANAAVAETGEEFVALTREDHPVVMDCENPPALGNGGVETAAPAASSYSESFQMVAAEATGYTKKSWESGSAFVEKLRRATSVESAVQIQSEYAKSAYTEFVAYLVKMSGLYCNLFKRGWTPSEKAAAKLEGITS